MIYMRGKWGLSNSFLISQCWKFSPLLRLMDLKDLIKESYILTIPTRRCALAWKDTMEEFFFSVCISWIALGFASMVSEEGLDLSSTSVSLHLLLAEAWIGKSLGCRIGLELDSCIGPIISGLDKGSWHCQFKSWGTTENIERGKITCNI